MDSEIFHITFQYYRFYMTNIVKINKKEKIIKQKKIKNKILLKNDYYIKYIITLLSLYNLYLKIIVKNTPFAMCLHFLEESDYIILQK